MKVTLAENVFENQDFRFTEEELIEIRGHQGKYPTVRSAVMPVLWMAQNKFGWLSQEAMQLVADTLGLSYAHVYGVASFYTMYFKQPVPKYVLDVCTCFACGELGGDEVLQFAKAYTQCDERGYSKDGLFFFRYAECLGACDTGPVAQLTNRHYVHHLTRESIQELIDQLRAGNEPSFVSIPLVDQSKI
jgi:NADH-quinone oxidoreductase subunit E